MDRLRGVITPYFARRSTLNSSIRQGFSNLALLHCSWPEPIKGPSQVGFSPVPDWDFLEAYRS